MFLKEQLGTGLIKISFVIQCSSYFNGGSNFNPSPFVPFCASLIDTYISKMLSFFYIIIKGMILLKKKINWTEFISKFVFWSLCIATISIIIIMIFAPSEHNDADPFRRIKSDYVLMLAQCILGILAIKLPYFLKEKIDLKIPSIMLFFYVLFLYAAIYLGEVRNFYFVVPHWDTILHTFSGGMLGAIGFSFITILNGTEKIPLNLSPIFVAFFSFCFAITLGAIWEIYEFTADGILQTNMQKFALENGTLLIGRDAVSDTMKDLIVDGIGALVISFIGFISLKHKKGWVEKLLFKFSKEK